MAIEERQQPPLREEHVQAAVRIAARDLEAGRIGAAEELLEVLAFAAPMSAKVHRARAAMFRRTGRTVQAEVAEEVASWLQ